MKTENMTFSEAYETMKQGYEVERKNPHWRLRKLNRHSLKLNEGGLIVDNKNEPIIHLPINDVLAIDWGIYTEPKPEPQFEIGELVMMREDESRKWIPQHFARTGSDGYYYPMSGDFFKHCAKFDKNIIFTDKPAKQ